MKENYVQSIDFFSEQEVMTLLEKDKKSFIGIIPKGIVGEEELMQVYFDKLNLAPYFGGNWDALNEVLVDFDWINTENIIIIHQDLPALAQKDLILLIKVLGRAVSIMRGGHTSEHQLPTGKHKLQVIFPKSFQKEIEKL